MGRVKSLKRTCRNGVSSERIIKERILSDNKNRDGYVYITLSKNKKEKKGYIHQLVAESFIDNISNKPQINHIDENKSNNRVDNLEWVTRIENCNYGTRNKRISEKLINGKNSKQLIGITENGLILEYKSLRECERKTGFKNSNISLCCNYKVEKAYNIKWRFIDEK